MSSSRTGIHSSDATGLMEPRVREDDNTNLKAVERLIFIRVLMLEVVGEQKIYTCRVENAEMLTPSIYRLFIQPCSEFLHYKPGQYIKIQSPAGTWLPFSIANALNPQNLIELHIRNYRDENLQSLIKQLLQSRELKINGPFGESYYKGISSSKILILAVGTGFAPAKAIMESLLNTRDYPNLLHFYWGVRVRDDLYFPSLPQQWLSNPWFKYNEVVSESNVLDQTMQDYANLSDFQVYFYGPLEMAERALQEFTQVGLKRVQLFSDML